MQSHISKRKYEFFLIFMQFGIEVIISVEDTPMGTGKVSIMDFYIAGPIALAKKYLEDDDLFFVFNSDVSCTYPLQELIDFHRNHGKEGTIVVWIVFFNSLQVTEVTDPSKYGVVVADETV